MTIKKGEKFIKILLVEYNFSSRKKLNSFLSPFGRIDIAVNGNEAISAVKKELKIMSHMN
jgi:hypothetical protein